MDTCTEVLSTSYRRVGVFYRVRLFVQRLHDDRVSALVDAVDRRLQLHLVAQLPGHALADLTGAAHELPLLQRTDGRTDGGRERRGDRVHVMPKKIG